MDPGIAKSASMGEFEACGNVPLRPVEFERCLNQMCPDAQEGTDIDELHFAELSYFSCLY